MRVQCFIGDFLCHAEFQQKPPITIFGFMICTCVCPEAKGLWGILPALSPGRAVLGALDGFGQGGELAPGGGPVVGPAVQAIGVMAQPGGPSLRPGGKPFFRVLEGAWDHQDEGDVPPWRGGVFLLGLVKKGLGQLRVDRDPVDDPLCFHCAPRVRGIMAEMTWAVIR